MADKKMTNVTIKSARDGAKELLSTALKEFEKTARAEEGEKPRLFFPNGIELISIIVRVSGVDVELKVAGKAGINSLLHSGEIGVDLTGKVGEEATGKQ